MTFSEQLRIQLLSPLLYGPSWESSAMDILATFSSSLTSNDVRGRKKRQEVPKEDGSPCDEGSEDRLSETNT